jgi:hypothetical protein
MLISEDGTKYFESRRRLEMKMSMMRTTILVCLVVFVAACAGPNELLDTPMRLSDVSGFWSALLHGFFLPFAFVGSLLTDGISIYDVHNTGGWYDFGFVIGISFWRLIMSLL